MRPKLALIAGLALLAAGLLVTLSAAPLSVVRVAGTPEQPIASLGSGARICQPGELLPAHTTDIRLSLWSTLGPRLTLTAYSGGRAITTGTHEPWSAGAVTVPVKPLARASFPVRICARLGSSPDATSVIGSQGAPAASEGSAGPLPGRIKVEDLRPSGQSWFSAAVSVARRMSFGRAPSGAWTIVLLVLTMAAAVTLAVWLAARELR